MVASERCAEASGNVFNPRRGAFEEIQKKNGESGAVLGLMWQWLGLCTSFGELLGPERMRGSYGEAMGKLGEATQF